MRRPICFTQIRLGDSDPDAISGARLLDERMVKVTDLTLCIRFNFQLLEYHEGRSRLVTIEDFRTNSTVS